MSYTVTVWETFEPDEKGNSEGTDYTGIQDWVPDDGMLWLYDYPKPKNKLREAPPVAIINLDRCVSVEFHKDE